MELHEFIKRQESAGVNIEMFKNSMHEVVEGLILIDDRAIKILHRFLC